VSETQRPEIDDSHINNWYLSFAVLALGVKPSLSGYADYSSLITSIPEDVLATFSIEDGNMVLSMLLENMSQRHAIRSGYAIMVTAFENANKSLVVKAARMALQNEIETNMQDISLEVIDLERQLLTIRDIDRP